MGKLMDRLYDNIDEAKAFALSFTNFAYGYDDLNSDDFKIVVCEECRKRHQYRDYLFPKSSFKKPTSILSYYDFGVSCELRDELIEKFDITEDDFRPIYTKKGELVYYQITPQNVMEPIYEENGWYITNVCPQCGAIQYGSDRPYRWHCNEKKEPFAFISQNALDNMHDLNISYERFLRYSADYVISRRLYDFLTERYPRTHYFPLFLKQETED